MAYGNQCGGHKWLPFVRTYAEADWLFSNSKPIRGRVATKDKYTALRPLGERRYVDAYSINKTAEGAVQLINYKSPVVTLYPDGRVVVKPYWVSMSTAQFISEVTPVSARCTKGFMVLSLELAKGAKGMQYACKKDDSVTFRVEHSSWSVEDSPTQKQYVLNRAGANNVRARFKAFYQYMKGFLKIRGQVDEPVVVRIAIQEMLDALDVKGEWNWGLMGAAAATTFMLSKPQNNSIHQKNNAEAWSKWEREVEEFVRLISTADTDPGQASAFYTATMMLIREHAGGYWGTNAKGTVAVSQQLMKDTLDAILFKFYSEECIEETFVEKGKIPCTKYNCYVTKRE